MSAYWQDGRDRASRRGAGVVLFKPPVESVRDRKWHIVDTHLGRQRLQWRPGIDVWHDGEAARFTAEFAGESKWVYIGPADDQ